MNKDIHYQGLSLVPDEYDCQDGQLAASVNLINENGNLNPIFPPKPTMQLSLHNKLIIVHKTTTQTNYIFLYGNGETRSLYFLQEPTTSDDTLPDDTGRTQIATLTGFRGISALGNTLIVACDDGLHYFLWQDNSYSNLGSKPPFISLQFALVREYSLTALLETDDYEVNIPSRTSPTFADTSKITSVDRAGFTQAIFAPLNTAIANASKKGLFTQPFFVRYAYRLYDGSYAYHSAPILMFPTYTPPLVKVSCSSDGGDNDNQIKATIYPFAPACSLFFKTPDIASTSNFAKKWGDIVTAIDIFVSAPIYTYDQSKDLEKPLSVDLPAWKDNNAYPVKTSSSFLEGHFFKPTERGRNSTDEITPDDLTFLDCSDQVSTDTDTGSYYANIPLHSEFYNKVKDNALFYLIASINVDDLPVTEDIQRLKLTNDDLSALVAKKTLPDDYQSHCAYIPSSLHTYNARLNLAGDKYTLAQPFPIASAVQYSKSNAPISEDGRVDYIKVYTKHNGVRCAVTITNNSTTANNMWSDYIKSSYPRYLFYPDPYAYKMEFAIGAKDGTQTIRRIALKQHDFLNGAYFYYGDHNINTPLADVSAETEPIDGLPSQVDVHNKVYTSAVENPFVFPASSITTVGNGKVIALSSAAKALSQGQFGQFPMYAFTTEGVWAMEVNTDGTFRSRQPITRDVCLGKECITQIDSSVLFATARGIMNISGANAVCISDILNSETPPDLMSLPNIDQLHSFSYDSHTTAPYQLLPFSRFISQSCRIAYDYSHQRIILFNPGFNYAYVFSLKSNLWGTMNASYFQYAVNNYPDSLVVDGNNQLLSLSAFGASSVNGLLITRPLKLELPDVLKTISTAIQRGVFARGDVATAIFGSRDLYHWHLIWSSKDHYLRGFSGTPYKYFRIAAAANLANNASISGVSVAFTPKLLNQLR